MARVTPASLAHLLRCASGESPSSPLSTGSGDRAAAEAELAALDAQWRGVEGSNPAGAAAGVDYAVALCALATGLTALVDVNDLSGNEDVQAASVRLLAAISLRRLIEKLWRAPGHRRQQQRQHSEHGFSEEARRVIRASLLQALTADVAALVLMADGGAHPQNPQLELQLSLCAAHAARLEPNFHIHWPDLLPLLLQLSQQSCSDVAAGNAERLPVARRSLTALHHVFQQLSSSREPEQMKQFQSFERDVWSVGMVCAASSLRAYSDIVASWQPGQGVASAADQLRVGNQTRDCGELARRALQVCTTLIRFASPSIRKANAADAGTVEFRSGILHFTIQTCDSVAHMQQERCALTISSSATLDVDSDSVSTAQDDRITSADRVISVGMKFLSFAQQKHPEFFAPLVIPLCNFLTRQLCFAVEEGGVSTWASMANGPRFVVAAVLQLEGILRCSAYRTSDDAPPLVDDFFQLETVQPLVAALVQCVALLSSDDLESMQEDPEMYVIDEESDNLWQHTPRAAAVHFLTALVNERRAALSVFVVEELLQQLRVSRGSLLTENSDVIGEALRREAAYSVISACYFDLHDDIGTVYSCIPWFLRAHSLL
jgi:Importin-beta N-terminal domain